MEVTQDLPSSTDIPNQTEPISETFLNKKQWKLSKLSKVTEISDDSRLYRFDLESEDQVLGLPTGQHVYLKLIGSDQRLIQRAYTPVSKEHQKGSIEFVIKLSGC